jgi:hypothetical protein
MNSASQLTAVLSPELQLARAQQEAANANHEQLNAQYAQCLAQVNETVKALMQEMVQLRGSLVRTEEEKNILQAAHNAELKAWREENGQLKQAVADLSKEILGLQQRQDAERRRFDTHRHGTDIQVYAQNPLLGPHNSYPNNNRYPQYEPAILGGGRPQFARGVTGPPQ